jgi:hypothetical protein
MRGDVTDIRGRMRAVLPTRWFDYQTPNFDAILTCIATPWAWLYGLTQYAISQTRLMHASDQWLDLIASDFFGDSLRRNATELDSSYRSRIQWELIQEAATRPAVAENIRHRTGFPPHIFEPGSAADTGAYGAVAGGSTAEFLGLAYGAAGGWGTLLLPFQFFLTARRPVNQSVSMLAGYGTGLAGYGMGPIAYANLELFAGDMSDADIYRSLARILPVTATAWVRIF